MNPRLIIDRDNDIWTLVQGETYYSDAYNTNKALQDLNAEYGPLRELIPSAELDIYKPFIHGENVKIDLSHLSISNNLIGRVQQYNIDSNSYNIVVTIHRNHVSE